MNFSPAQRMTQPYQDLRCGPIGLNFRAQVTTNQGSLWGNVIRKKFLNFLGKKTQVRTKLLISLNS